MITLQTWWPIQNSIWLPTALKRQLSFRSWNRQWEKENNHPSTSHCFYLACHVAETPSRSNVSPHDKKDIGRERTFSLQNMHNCIALQKGLLMDICMNLPHLFCIQLLIMVLSTSQSWLMVVGMQRTIYSADFLLGRVGKKQYKTAPTHCLQWRQLLWVPFGGFGGNQAAQEPGAWEMRQLGKSFTTMMEAKFFRAHLSRVKIAQSHISHAMLNENSD